MQIASLLAQLGVKPSRRRLKQRCEDVLAQAAEIYDCPGSAALRKELSETMEALEAMLDAEFRVTAVGVAPVTTTEALPKPSNSLPHRALG